ncbi:hypothetical protein [Roseicyclus persicicus]|uniref:DUF1440 domain-containing protein n=1 Tax=Roseicyclus persicicus TaxID=2650661 RepID=A0A7X6GWA1_9RHOB|nr:hypothetical protein [Roseibacterium persicicum]NKX43539.1 hypothetical protein [Roseibacterium persicicum]
MADSPGRLRSALSLALAGAVTLFAALVLHEMLVFGPAGHDLIGNGSTPCPAPPCLTTGTVVTGLIAKAIGAAFAFAAIGAIWAAGRARTGLGAGFWALQYLWSLVGMASGYRDGFPGDWDWWEPFAVLLWHPVLTPALMALGLGGFLGLDRLVRRG